MTSSFTQSVANTSRAMCAVVTASLTVRQPAVLGSTRTPSAPISSRKRSPMRPRACSRRSETVTMPAPDACTALASTCGEGYCAVPISMRDGSSTPYSVSALFALAVGSGAFMIAAQPPCRGETISMRSPIEQRRGRASALRDEVAVARRGDAGASKTALGNEIGQCGGLRGQRTAIDQDRSLTRAAFTFTVPMWRLRAVSFAAQFNRLRPENSSALDCCAR